MHIMQSRRRFLTSLSLAGAAGSRWCTEVASRRATAGNDHGPPAEVGR